VTKIIKNNLVAIVLLHPGCGANPVRPRPEYAVRSNLDWDRFSEITIGIPPINVQSSIVEIFNAYLMRKEINEKLKAQIKNICPILIKGSLKEAASA